MIVRRVRRRLQGDAGVGLIELLIAMTILTVAVGALLAVFASSITALSHSGKEGTAVTIADRQLETYRPMTFNCIPSSLPVSAPAGCGTYTGFPNPYADSQLLTAAESPDHRAYRVLTAVTAVGSSRQIKVTVALNAGGPILAQETSYFSSAGTSAS